jgi:DNA-binding transcriptional MerR regulator
MKNYTRKTLATKLGIGIETLRYYEKIGLISPPGRMANGYRIYTEEDALNIEHIIAAKKYGFSLEELKSIWAMHGKDNLDNEDLIKILSDKIKDVETQITELKNLKTLILSLIKSYR